MGGFSSLGHSKLTFNLTPPNILAMLGEMYDQYDHLRIKFHLIFCRICLESRHSKRSIADAAAQWAERLYLEIGQSLRSTQDIVLSEGLL